MVFHQILQSCQPDGVLENDKIRAKVEYKEPIGLAPATAEIEVDIGTVVEQDATQLYKGDVVVAHAKALIVIADRIQNQDWPAAIAIADAMVAWLETAATALGDPEVSDIAAMMAPITERTIWIEMAGFPYAGTYVGRDAIVAGVFKRIGEEWEGYDFRLERLVDGGTTIVGIGTYSGVYRKTGKKMSARVVHVWDLADGKVTRFEQFTDTKLVAEALS